MEKDFNERGKTMQKNNTEKVKRFFSYYSHIIVFLSFYIITFIITNYYKNSDIVKNTAKIVRNNLYSRAGQMNLYEVISSQWTWVNSIFSGIIATIIVGIIHKDIKGDNKEDKQISNFNKLMSNLFFFIIIFIGIYYYQYTSFIKPAKFWNSFEKSIIKITPYVEDKDIKLLRSKWVLMNSERDFLEIQNKIDEIEEKIKVDILNKKSAEASEEINKLKENYDDFMKEIKNYNSAKENNKHLNKEKK